MTKAAMVEQIEFALSELADVRIELRRIVDIPMGERRPGELYAEAEARMVGRCQGMAENATMFLSLAVENLRQCLGDPAKPIAPLFTTRTSDPKPAARPNSNTKERSDA
jgi:hypothetical protein